MGCAQSSGGGGGQALTKPNPVATFDSTMGMFKAEIHLDRVRTASKFIDLCQTGFYNWYPLPSRHSGFHGPVWLPICQGPNSRNAGTGGPPDGTFKNIATGVTEKRFGGGSIKDENISKDTITNAPGTLSMANTGQHDSGGSQFFLNVNNKRNLDWFSSGPSKHPRSSARSSRATTSSSPSAKCPSRTTIPARRSR